MHVLQLTYLCMHLVFCMLIAMLSVHPSILGAEVVLAPCMCMHMLACAHIGVTTILITA